MTIPFVDLHAQYLSIQYDIDSAIECVIRESSFIGGPYVKAFEDAYAGDYGVRHCVSVANGTDALYIALRMLGIGAGDEVVTTALSWISTSETISQTGARPVFIDVDEFYTIDADLVEQAITPRTKAIIPVHLYGQPADMTRIMEIAARHRLLVIEDCAQAHYATWEGRRVGTFGHVGTFSFFPGKNLGAYGDAGAIVTNDDDLAKRMRMYANHGALKKHHHQMEGVNSRLDGLQAAILSAKLPHIHDWTDRRRQVAAWYDAALRDVPELVVPRVRDGAGHVYHLYVVRVPERDALMAYLADHGIATGVHYPTALPALPAYEYLRPHQGPTPRAVAWTAEILSLPIYPELSQDAVREIVGKITQWVRARF